MELVNLKNEKMKNRQRNVKLEADSGVESLFEKNN